MRGAHPESDVRYVEGRPELYDVLARTLSRGDLCLTLGAGDLTSLPDEIPDSGAAMSDAPGTPPDAARRRALQTVVDALGSRATR